VFTMQARSPPGIVRVRAFGPASWKPGVDDTAAISIPHVRGGEVAGAQPGTAGEDRRRSGAYPAAVWGETG